MIMDLKQPKKFCKNCGSLIPANGEIGEFGMAKRPQLICESCARTAAPPKPRVQRLRPGEKHPDQGELDEGPGIYIG